MTAWAFVDHENVPDFTHLDLSRYERILVFCGPGSKKLKIDQLPGDGFCRLEFLRISSRGKNNLDFHLAFHLGRLHEQAGPGIAFHILSGDKGFDGLTQHLKDLKRTCKRLEPAPPPPPPLGEAAGRIVQHLDNAKQSRPRKETTLLKWIASHCRKDDPAPESLLEELKQARQFSVQNGAVTYTLTSGPES